MLFFKLPNPKIKLLQKKIMIINFRQLLINIEKNNVYNKLKNLIYVYINNEHLKKERRYIFGKSKNLTFRLSTHEIIYYQSCSSKPNMVIVEKLVLNKLDKSREVENRDRFILPEDKEIDFVLK